MVALLAIAGFVLVSLAARPAAAQSTTFRCEGASGVTYSDRPCPAGAQRALDRVPAPSAADQGAAASRQRADAARLSALERERAREQRDDDRAAAAARRSTDHGRQARTCAKLALRAKRAREEADRSGPRELQAKQSRLHRAEDDFSALCKTR